MALACIALAAAAWLDNSWLESMRPNPLPLYTIDVCSTGQTPNKLKTNKSTSQVLVQRDTPRRVFCLHITDTRGVSLLCWPASALAALTR